jgi:hypothetical protein
MRRLWPLSPPAPLLRPRTAEFCWEVHSGKFVFYPITDPIAWKTAASRDLKDVRIETIGGMTQ